MKSVNGKIVVKVNLDQKNTMRIGDMTVSTALKFEKNYREKSPVIAVVVSGNKWLKDGSIICCHHNHFYPPSPYWLQDDLYSIPFNKTIFGYFDSEGNLIPLCYNLFGTQIEIPSLIPLPPERIEKYKDRVTVLKSSTNEYIEGDTVFTRPSAPYEIVYNWNGIEKRITKVDCTQICGVIKK